MPYDDPDPADPYELVGMSVPADADCTREMVYTFAEEFALMGRGEDGIVDLFRDPFYGSAHAALVELGEEEVRRIARECVAVFGGRRVIDVAPLGPDERLDSFE